MEPADPLFVVRYADDEPYPFAEGVRRRFGRDDSPGTITIWEQIRTTTLSSTAGELWCSGAQMWVRNLSEAHELVVLGSATPPTVLAVRAGGPGHACSVPWPRGSVGAPSTGDWALQIEAVGVPTASVEDAVVSIIDLREHVPTAQGERTVRISDVPAAHQPVAEALCAPVLAGGAGPATYAEIAAVLGTTPRVARRRVEKLVERYAEQVHALPGAQRPGETMTSAVARLLVQRGKRGARSLPSTDPA